MSDKCKLMINVAHCKEYALAASIANRNGKFTRVSVQFIERLDARLRAIIQAEVQQHPSLGCTLK